MTRATRRSEAPCVVVPAKGESFMPTLTMRLNPARVVFGRDSIYPRGRGRPKKSTKAPITLRARHAAFEVARLERDQRARAGRPGTEKAVQAVAAAFHMSASTVNRARRRCREEIARDLDAYVRLLTTARKL